MGELHQVAIRWMLMVESRAIVGDWRMLLTFEDWMTRIVLEVMESRFVIAIGRVHLIVSFVVALRTVLVNPWPIAHHIPRRLTRVHSGPWCRSRGRRQGVRGTHFPICTPLAIF